MKEGLEKDDKGLQANQVKQPNSYKEVYSQMTNFSQFDDECRPILIWFAPKLKNENMLEVERVIMKCEGKRFKIQQGSDNEKKSLICYLIRVDDLS